ncbi:MAG: transposase [Roseovarius sp.]|nr:transposase [Roseovarius sp.]
MNNDTIGVDISKAHLDAHRLTTGERARFDNTATGFKALKRWLGAAQPDLIVFEPTGPCHRDFEAAFAGHLPLCKVNPLQARRFAQAHGTRAKTDAVDAAMLALMGRALELVPDRPTDEIQIVLRDLRVARSGLVRDRTALMNRLAAARLPLVRRLVKARLAQAERQIATLDAEIDACLDACPKRRRAAQILTSIPGIGRITASAPSSRNVPKSAPCVTSRSPPSPASRR